MKFQKGLVLNFLLVTALVSQFNWANAGDVPGYIGNQSFNITDDPQLNNLTRQAENAKYDVARADQMRDQTDGQLRGFLAQRERIFSHMNDLQSGIDATKSSLNSLQAKLSDLNKNPDVNKDQISQTKSQIDEANQRITDLQRQLGATKLDLGPVNVRIDQLQHDLQVATANYQNAMNRLQSIARDRDYYRQELISAISRINNEGANRGQVDGSNDGVDLSRRLGQDIGSRDGDADGTRQGTSDGQTRYYQQGEAVGEKEGSAKALSDGQRDGSAEGQRDGNISAGSREGKIAGVKRANASDAAAVGTQQGNKAGMDRAISTGSINGNNKGEAETVLKYESGNLNSITIDGPFAGSFQRRSPDYPGDFNGQSYNPRVYNSRDVLARAYADGYIYQYRQYTRYEYLRRIDSYYNSVYDSHYSSTYNQANGREYPEYYDRGRSDGYRTAYSRDYPVVKAQAYKVAFDQADSNPTRSSDNFKNAYKNSELEAYNDRYEQIRSANFDVAELKTFNANIAGQTEIYRQKRIGEVTTVYNNNAVLSYVSSEMLDGGINGVAKLDGVFQPGETTLHSITLKNFGMTAAKNVSVQLDNGAIVKLPEIPARSVVTVKGAGSSKIAANAQIGSTAKTTLKVVSKLTSDDAIEAAHFDSIGEGILKRADQKSTQVAFPLSLSNLSLSTQLIKGVKNNLHIAVTNNSKRAYNGELKIKVLVNSQSQVLTKDFGVLSSLNSSAQLGDAEVLVNSESDIYRDLDFSASISQNGVTLGVLGSDLVAMAKAQYIEKANAPVIVANSDKNLNQLLDALALIGGTEKASVLDLSLASMNSGILTNGLDQKVILITDDEKGSNISSLNTLVAKSKSSAFVFIDETNTGLRNAMNLVSLKDAQSLLWDRRQVVFTNPYRAEGVVKSSSMIQSSLKDFDKDLTLANDLSQTAPVLLARIKSEVNRTSFFTPSNAIKMFSLKALSEVLCINKAYAESGGIFTRNKKLAEMINSDGTLFINVLKNASAGEVNEGKLGTVLSAIAMKDTLSNAISNVFEISKVVKLKIKNTTNKVLGNMEDDFKNSLKKFDKDLYNKAYEKASIHRPFFIDQPNSTPY